MKFFNLRKFNYFLFCALMPFLANATSISKGLSGVQTVVQQLVDTLCGPIAFIISVAAFIGSAAAWKFMGHHQGIKAVAGTFAGIIIIANAVAWIGYFAGAVI